MVTASDEGKRRMPRVRLGGIAVNAGYTRWSGGGWGGPGYWGPWGPAYGLGPWYGGYGFGNYFYPGFFTGYGWGPSRGEVKLTTAEKNAEVFIDGAFAGTAGKLKSMWLDAGVYTLEVRPQAGQPFQKKIYVLSGKTLRLEAR